MSIPSTTVLGPAPTARVAAPRITAAAPVASHPGAPAAAAAHGVCDAPSNVTVRDDSSGFEITLVVADKLCFSRTEDITLQVAIRNTTTHDLQYDPNQTRHFVMQSHGASATTAPARWDDAKCTQYGQDEAQTKGGPLTLSPGEREVLKDSLYPGPTSDPSRESCRTLSGLLDVYGEVAWCRATPPPGYCNPDVTLFSTPIEIRIG